MKRTLVKEVILVFQQQQQKVNNDQTFIFISSRYLESAIVSKEKCGTKKDDKKIKM